MNKFKVLAFVLSVFMLATASFANPKDRLDNWKARADWPFGTSDNQMTMGFLKDATTTDLSPKLLKYVKSIGEQFNQDLAVWQAAQKDSSLKSHKNFPAFDKEVRNCNDVRKQISNYMQYDFLLPLKTIFIKKYDDGTSVLVEDASGKHLRELTPTFEKKFVRYATQVAPIFGGKKDKMGKMILDQIDSVLSANKNSAKLIKKGHAKQKSELAKNEKYNPQKRSVNNQSKLINDVKNEYARRFKQSKSNVIDVSPTYEKASKEINSLNQALDKYKVEGELLAKEGGTYVKYTFQFITKKIYGSSTTERYDNIYKKSTILPENVASEYRK